MTQPSIPLAVSPHATSRATLRAATAAEHGALERELRITAADVEDADRVRYLAALHGWLRATGEGLWDHGWSRGVRPRRRAAKLDWLAADLRACGLDPAALPAPDWSVPAGLPGVRPALAYVHEGSLLGGAVLQRRWAAAGSPLAQGRYLAGYGAAAGSMWRTFVAELERVLPTEARREQAAVWAVEAFRSLRRWCAAQGVVS